MSRSKNKIKKGMLVQLGHDTGRKMMYLEHRHIWRVKDSKAKMTVRDILRLESPDYGCDQVISTRIYLGKEAMRKMQQFDTPYLVLGCSYPHQNFRTGKSFDGLYQVLVCGTQYFVFGSELQKHFVPVED